MMGFVKASVAVIKNTTNHRVYLDFVRKNAVYEDTIPTLAPFLPTAAPSSTMPSQQPAMFETTVPTKTPSQPATATTMQPATTAPSNSTTFRCNGLGNLCNLAVDKILFATVHNAAATVADNVTLYPNHAKSLEDALTAGYRGINVDIGKCNNEIRLVHGFCGLGSRDPIEALSNIVSFVQANPNEVILMPTQIDYSTGGTVTLNEIDSMMQQVPGLKDLMYNHGNTDTPWPTLGELIQNNTRILFFHYDGERCFGAEAVTCPYGFHDWFEFAGESQFVFYDTSQLDDKAYACQITRGGGGFLDFYGVNVFTLLPSNASCVTLNTKENLANHIQACSNLTGRVVNLLVVDCWDVGDVLAVVQEINESL
jgi:hypothetical protein